MGNIVRRLKSVALVCILTSMSEGLGSAHADGVQSGGASADGVSAYYAVLPLDKNKTDGIGERKQRPNSPSGSLVHNLMVTLFNSATLQHIVAKRVIATISKDLEPREKKELFPHAMGGFSMYGNSFTLRVRHRYHVHLDVVVPNREQPVRLDFEFVLE